MTSIQRFAVISLSVFSTFAIAQQTVPSNAPSGTSQTTTTTTTTTQGSAAPAQDSAAPPPCHWTLPPPPQPCRTTPLPTITLP